MAYPKRCDKKGCKSKKFHVRSVFKNSTSYECDKCGKVFTRKG